MKADECYSCLVCDDAPLRGLKVSHRSCARRSGGLPCRFIQPLTSILRTHACAPLCVLLLAVSFHPKADLGILEGLQERAGAPRGVSSLRRKTPYSVDEITQTNERAARPLRNLGVGDKIEIEFTAGEKFVDAFVEEVDKHRVLLRYQPQDTRRPCEWMLKGDVRMRMPRDVKEAPRPARPAPLIPFMLHPSIAA